MHADQFQILVAKEQLQKAVLIADDPAPRRGTLSVSGRAACKGKVIASR
jgi:hypothetical protein